MVYTPGYVRALIRYYVDYLESGKVPPLRYTALGWVLHDVEVISDNKHSDGLEAIRVKSDLDNAMRRDQPWPLTTTQIVAVNRLGKLNENVRVFCQWYKAIYPRRISHREALSAYRAATTKMAKNLGWEPPHPLLGSKRGQQPLAEQKRQ